MLYKDEGTLLELQKWFYSEEDTWLAHGLRHRVTSCFRGAGQKHPVLVAYNAQGIPLLHEVVSPKFQLRKVDLLAKLLHHLRDRRRLTPFGYGELSLLLRKAPRVIVGVFPSLDYEENVLRMYSRAEGGAEAWVFIRQSEAARHHEFLRHLGHTPQEEEQYYEFTRGENTLRRLRF